ncbi:glycoside hydrolase family 43 protein [uncultured Sphaerochaeta sp.]|uniref:glycoside hydrolase family 43 protein n=1 Tax=uncultured Sphaerochaeta sp. TaxID=886478 RepID=UPI002A0A6211|nr:glycoside hydrolase family 43 protein [uncultured Sphaerochaeta sp.]
MKIINPVLPGFHPDPSICRVDDTFYIANSTFEWFPCVTIHRSKNLRDWELVPRPMDTASMPDLSGHPASGGIWAPCLSYADGRFWLVYTDVKSWDGTKDNTNHGFKDCLNYLTTATAIEGPWTKPVFLNASGFDPSLFHDVDGKKWLVNVLWDYRIKRNNFAGIVMQEYSMEQQCLIGDPHRIFVGTELGFTEAPHVYRHGSYYYLMTAEGGTGYAHAITMARSKSLEGPYHVMPNNPLLSSVSNGPEFLTMWGESGFDKAKERYLRPGLQKAGHGSMAPLTEDTWILAHLCARPLQDGYHCILGRETALQLVYWKKDEWPNLEANHPNATFDIPLVCTDTTTKESGLWKEEFSSSQWSPELMTLRIFSPEAYSLTERPGWITLKGGESPTSRFRQTLLARRVTSLSWRSETCIDYIPQSFQQFAGLLVRYDENSQVYQYISQYDGKRILSIMIYDGGTLSLPMEGSEIILPPSGAVYLAASMEQEAIRFSWSLDNSSWKFLSPSIPGSLLSDENATPMGFTGMFVGIASHDVSGMQASAYFDYLQYQDIAST